MPPHSFPQRQPPRRIAPARIFSDHRWRLGFAVKARREELELKPGLVGLITQS
jgi:hypothetical protein